MHWKTYLESRSRDPRYLWRVVLAILAVGGGVAIAVNLILEEPLRQPHAEQGLGDRDSPDTPRPETDDTAGGLLDEAIDAHDWWRVWWLIPRVSWFEIDWGPAAVAGLTALFWLLFILQAGQVESPRKGGFWLCVTAVVLGALSTWPTLFVGEWQKEMWQLEWTGEEGLAAGLRYYVVGVGLREELIKLAFFLPLLPLVLSRKNELERLVVASCVGIGFAAEENVLYFGDVPADSVARFVTANFAHLALTGLAGLWLCRAIRWPKECLPHFLAYFGLIIVGHGAYDAFISLPKLTDYAIVSSILFIGLAYIYFRELRELRPQRREVISLTANFVVGLAILAAVTFAYVTALVGWYIAGEIYFKPAVEASIMAYVFLREAPESLVRT